MSIGTLIYTQLAADSGVSTLVSTRIYPDILPQRPSVPAMTYTRISNSPQLGTSSLRRSRYQLDCWDLTADGSEALASAVKSAMEEHHDQDQTPGILMAEVDNEIGPTRDEETELYRVIIDVLCITNGD